MANTPVSMRVSISADLNDIKQGLAALRGQLQQVRKDAESVGASAGTAKISAGQFNAAMRGLPAQFTDIVTSLQGGQKPLTVLFQQGGQIKDQFGGVGNALKGVGAAIAEMITPASIGIGSLAAVFGTLGYAIYDAHQRQIEFEKTADGIGKWGGITAGTLKEVTDAVSDYAKVSLDSAADIVSAVAGTGQYTINEVQQVSQAIAAYAGDDKDAIKDVLKTYAEIADDPIKALSELVDKHAELSSAEIQNAVDLANAGDKIGAVAAVTRDYTDFLEKHVNANRSFWSYLKEIPDDISRAIGALEQQQTAEGIAEQLQNMRDNDPNAASGAYYKQQEARLQQMQRDSISAAIKKAMDFDAGGASASVTGQDVTNVSKIAAEIQNWNYANTSLAGSIQKIRDKWNPLIKSARAVGDAKAVANAISQQKKEIDAATAKADKKKPNREKKQVDDSGKIASAEEEATRIQLSTLDDQYKSHQVSIEDYYKQRAALSQQLIDLQIKETQHEIDAASNPDLKKALQVKIDSLKQQRDAYNDVSAAIEKARQAQEKADQDALNKRVSVTTSDLSDSQTTLSAQMTAGTIGYTEGQAQIKSAREKAIADLQAERQAQLDVLNGLSTTDPNYAAAIKGLQNIDTSIANITASLHDMQNQIKDSAVNSLSDELYGVATGAEGAGKAIKNMATSFAQAMLQIASQKAATSAVNSLFDWIGKLGSATSGSTSSSGVGLEAASAILKELPTIQLHGGGNSSMAATMRHGMNPMVFGEAPRFHEGTYGLRADEMAAILRRDETVRTPQQERALQTRLSQSNSRAAQINQTFIVQGTPDRRTSAQMAATAARKGQRALKRSG